MPFCEVRTNVELAVGDRESLLREISSRVSELLGKPESYVMVQVEDGRAMSFAGTTEPLCLVRLASLGFPEERTREISAAITELCEERIGVTPDRCYMEFSSPPRHMWGYNGGTFG